MQQHQYVAVANQLETLYAEMMFMDWLEQMLEYKFGLREDLPDPRLLVRGTGVVLDTRSKTIGSAGLPQNTIGFMLDPIGFDISAKKQRDDSRKSPTLEEMVQLKTAYEHFLETRRIQMLVLFKTFCGIFLPQH